MIADMTALDRPASGRLPLTPARRAILALGVPVALALIGGTAFSLAADVGTGSYRVNQSIPISDGRLSASLGGGDVTVQGGVIGAGGPAHLTGTVAYTFARPPISVTDPDGQGAVVALDCRITINTCGLNSTLALPAATAATIASDGGDMTATGLTGYASLSTGGGDLTATDLSGYASLQTSGGDLTAAQLSGDLTIGTSGGDINATYIASRHVTADSGGGDVEITFTQVPTDVQVSADGGNVTLILPPGSASYNVTASADGGNLSDSLPLSSASSRTISVSSGGGDITIERAGN